MTLCHTGTRDLAAHTRGADIVVAAAGVAHLITADMVKPGAAVLDVGITRTDAGLVGDVDPEVREVAAYLAPMPGGVGPMTRAMLLANVVESAERAAGSGLSDARTAAAASGRSRPRSPSSSSGWSSSRAGTSAAGPSLLSFGVALALFLRLLLPSAEAGLLAVRSKRVDVVVLAFLAVGDAASWRSGCPRRAREPRRAIAWAQMS